MELSEITRSSRLRMLELPIEIHLGIQNQLLNDPDTTMGQLRSLRLVCKMFDNIWLPFAMTNMALIPSNLAHPPYGALVQYLQFLVHGKGNTTNYTTLTIRNWHRFETELDRFSTDIRQLWGEGLMKTLIWILFLIFTHFIIALASLIFYLLLLLVQPHKIPYHISRVFNARRARNQVASLPGKLDVSSIRCCRLFIDSRERDWAMDHSAKVLLSLPQLTELELGISMYTDLEYVVRRLAPLNRLRKLTLLRATVTSFHIRSLSTLIAHNGNLTHLDYDLLPNVPQDLAELFSDVSTDRPLRLYHMSLNSACTNFEALAPHVQSLFSFEYHSGPRNPWCIPFVGAEVFPPTIKVESIDQNLITFIETHPGIASLSIATSRVPQDVVPESLGLFQVLRPHTETLRRLSLNTKLFALSIQNTENEMSFLQCSKNLRELVLEADASLLDYQNSNIGIHNEQRLFPVIALLSRSLTVVIRTQDKAIFHLCVEFCLGSENSLIRDLVRRIAYERRSS